MSRRLLSIYDYENYRIFLKDFFDVLKKRKRGFSQRSFAREAGFATHSFLTHIIRGERNLGEDSIGKLTNALDLSAGEGAYFGFLVRFNQAETAAEREKFFDAMNSLRRNSRFYKLDRKHYSYLDKWYYPVVRELAVMQSWNGDYRQLADMVRPRITESQARRAVETLIETGLLTKETDGTLLQNSAALTADDWPPHLITKARREFLQLAIEASEKLPADQRNISCATVALSRTHFQEISKMLDEIRERIVHMAAGADNAEEVYQLNLQLFPLSCTQKAETDHDQK